MASSRTYPVSISCCHTVVTSNGDAFVDVKPIYKNALPVTVLVKEQSSSRTGRVTAKRGNLFYVELELPPKHHIKWFTEPSLQPKCLFQHWLKVPLSDQQTFSERHQT